jgi:hypothetical protein
VEGSGRTVPGMPDPQPQALHQPTRHPNRPRPATLMWPYPILGSWTLGRCCSYQRGAGLAGAHRRSGRRGSPEVNGRDQSWMVARPAAAGARSSSNQATRLFRPPGSPSTA